MRWERNGKRGCQTGPNSSSNRSPNQASKTAISAAVTGTLSGQSSLTSQFPPAALGGRRGNGHGSPSRVSRCADAVGSWRRDGRGIPPESATPKRRGTAYLYARLRCVLPRANTGERRPPAFPGDAGVASTALPSTFFGSARGRSSVPAHPSYAADGRRRSRSARIAPPEGLGLEGRRLSAEARGSGRSSASQSPSPRLRPSVQSMPPPGMGIPSTCWPRRLASVSFHGTSWNPKPLSIMANRPLLSWA